jgi:N,N'-diacetyllegionaminate synthase
MDEMRTRFDCPVGLSDHSGSPFPAFAALARGANIIELHITLDRRMFGPDTCASLTVAEFSQVSAFRDALFQMDAGAVDKDRLARELIPTRHLFVRSLAPVHALRAGTVLTAEMIAPKKTRYRYSGRHDRGLCGAPLGARHSSRPPVQRRGFPMNMNRFINGF